MTFLEALQDAAYQYTAQGTPLFLTKVGDKTPITLHGFRDAISHYDLLLRNGLARHPHNLGMPTGSCSGWCTFDILDIDVKGGVNGWAAFYKLRDAGLLTGAQRLVRTPSGGGHLYFAGTAQRSGALHRLGLECKANGGYVLVPPSVVDEVPYQIMDDRPPTGAVLDWPACKRLLEGPKRVWVGKPSSRLVGSLPDRVREQGTGNRNSYLFWAACRAAEAGNEAVLLELVEVAVEIGLPRDEALRTVVSATKEVTNAR